MTVEQVSKRFMNWASILEQNTCEQVRMTSEMPFIYPHVALMPDAHLELGMRCRCRPADARGDYARRGRLRCPTPMRAAVRTPSTPSVI